VGISGGIDSAVVAAIANLHKDIKVLGVWMNIDNSVLDVKCVADLKKQNLFPIIDVNLIPIFNAYKKTLKLKNDLSISNIKARLRAVALYAIAQENNLLVAGTGNADELYMGYFTKFGDGACDLLPIAQLTKSRIFEAAKILKLPSSIIERAPSASLYEDQTDEDEMGVKYVDIDAFLYNKKIPKNSQDIIQKFHRVNGHKFNMPPKPVKFEKIKC
jgi:NAD+ synthase